ncbi:ERI1 exoribonuclease 2 [Xyrichtys novacula]|uniref:ERI1 exoribonuclease 2 n=1 Tax=Xyrichtys novacula TaxID=13765 RepID=A0AAV1EYM5_XYRNO|nr:ERI1 exoribonuclease 2 [Xyrichtys novacula]
MSTKKLARKLGLLRQRSQSSQGSKKSLISNQSFSYLIVIDFESTCWKEKNYHSQEIIEFPAVLLNTSTGEIESEFHTYVQPQEHPTLSEFCTELTGITQAQVEAGIPLQICLPRFGRWLQNLQLEKGVVFPNTQQKSAAESPSQKLCTFVTWSDWDLGVCLQYECKRKQLYKPDVLNSWIDLRSTYRMFYDRKPKGLNGALQDLGIQFSGREHSGLDDARNTAQLAARMMRDGCVMKITRSLVKTPLMVKPVSGTTDNKTEKPDREENTLSTNKLSSCQRSSNICHIKAGVEKVPKDSDTKEDSGLVCQNLISPKTLLNGTTTFLLGHSRRSFTAKSVDNNSSSSSSLVLCSTTLGCLSNLPQTNAAAIGEEEEGGELLVETEDRCGSYDDGVLEGDTDFVSDAEYVSGVDSECQVWEEPEDTLSVGHHVTLKDNIRQIVGFKNSRKEIRESPTTSLGANNMSSYITVSSTVKESVQHSTISVSNFEFAVPKPLSSKSNQHKLGPKTSARVEKQSNGSNKNSNLITPFLVRHKTFIPEKTSTPYPSFARPNSSITRPPNHTLKSSFTIYTDPENSSSSSMCGSFSTPKTAPLSSLSTNAPPSRTDRSSSSETLKRGRKITSPLCACGRRAKRQVVSNGGPNHGRGFYCCPVRRSGGGGQIKKGCEFFKWESALMKSSSVSSPAVRSSVSLCLMSSALGCGPHQRSGIRKSC